MEEGIKLPENASESEMLVFAEPKIPFIDSLQKSLVDLKRRKNKNNLVEGYKASKKRSKEIIKRI